MKFAKISELWSLGNRRVSDGRLTSLSSQTVEREGIGEYRVQQHVPYTSLIHEDVHLSDEDKELLKNFLKNKSQTMGDILTINTREGSKIITSLDKLVDLGFVKRDWEKEVEMGELTIYSITPDGRYMAQKFSG